MLYTDTCLVQCHAYAAPHSTKDMAYAKGRTPTRNTLPAYRHQERREKVKETRERKNLFWHPT